MKVLFLLILLIPASCTTEYVDHIRRENTSIVSSSTSGEDLSDGVLITLPDKQKLVDLIADLDSAKDRIWLEIYTWTEKETIEALIRAKKRGVDVRVILEGNVYRTPWINNPTVKKIQEAGIPFAYSNNKKYRFTHIKMWFIDTKWCIGTGNWSYTSFTSNRDFIFCSYQKEILSDLEEIFLSDFLGVRPYFPAGLDDRIGLSPENIRPWIYAHITEAEESIIVYNQTISDVDVLEALSQKSKEGLEIQLCQSYKSDDAIGDDVLKYLHSLEFSQSKKPYLHAKIFLIDHERVLLGSANITSNALDNNREIFIDIGKNKKMHDHILSLYHKDCKYLYEIRD